MNIALVTDAFPPVVSGVATFYKHLSEILIRAGHKVIVIVTGPTRSKDNKAEVLENGLLKIFPGKDYDLYYKKYRPFFRPGGHDAPHWLAMSMSARNWLIANSEKYNIDIIEVSDYGGTGFFMLDDSLPPYIVTANSSLTQLYRFSNFSRTAHINVIEKLESFSFKYAGAVVAHSPFNLESLNKIINRNIELVEAPWNNINNPKANLGGDLPIVIGGLQAVKGSIFLAETVTEIQKSNAEFQIKWIGYDTFTAPSNKSMSSYLESNFKSIWQKNFLWVNEKTNEEAIEELAAASFVVIPSIWETFNYVALEAAALGKAIIITKTTGASSYFLHGVNALIVESENQSQMKDAISLLQKDVALRKRLGTAAAQVFDNNFIAEKTVQARIEIYQRTINNQTKTAGKEFDRQIGFLKKYLTNSRKGYYLVRALLKKILKPNASH